MIPKPKDTFSGEQLSAVSIFPTPPFLGTATLRDCQLFGTVNLDGIFPTPPFLGTDTPCSCRGVSTWALKIGPGGRGVVSCVAFFKRLVSHSVSIVCGRSDDGCVSEGRAFSIRAGTRRPEREHRTQSRKTCSRFPLPWCPLPCALCPLPSALFPPCHLLLSWDRSCCHSFGFGRTTSRSERSSGRGGSAACACERDMC